MNDVMQAVGVFFSYAVLAVFAQNAVFTRGLGVSRLVQPRPAPSAGLSGLRGGGEPV